MRGMGRHPHGRWWAAAIGVTVLGGAGLVAWGPGGAGTATAGDPADARHAVLERGGPVEAGLRAHLPPGADPGSARLAVADASGTYVAARGAGDAVCVVWFSPAGGVFGACGTTGDGRADRPPVVSVVGGGRLAGPAPRLVALVPDGVTRARTADGADIPIRGDVVSAPAGAAPLTLSGPGGTWTLDGSGAVGDPGGP